MNRVWMFVFLLMVWCGFSNDFQAVNIAAGALVILLLGWIVRYSDDTSYQSIKILMLFYLAGYTLLQLIKSSIVVGWDIIRVKPANEPEILTIPLSCQGDLEKTVLTWIISITPGTLFIDFTPDQQAMIIHAMFAKESTAVVNHIKNDLETKVMRAFARD